MEQVRNKREEYLIKKDILDRLRVLNLSEYETGHYESFMQDHIMHVAVDGSDLIVRLDKRVKRNVIADKSNAFSSRVTQQQSSKFGLRYYLNSNELSYVLAYLDKLVQREKEKERDPVVAWGVVFGRREEVRQSNVELYKSLDVKLTFY